MVGLDVSTGEPLDPVLSGIYDNYLVKKQILQSSPIIASQLLLVDEVGCAHVCWCRTSMLRPAWAGPDARSCRSVAVACRADTHMLCMCTGNASRREHEKGRMRAASDWAYGDLYT